MKLMTKNILSEYNKHGYRTIEYSQMSHAVLVKTELVNGKRQHKAIVLLLAHAYNIRNSNDAFNITNKLTEKIYEKVEPENTFIILNAPGGQGHHFLSGRIAYFNWTKREVSNKIYAHKFKEEAMILKNLYRAEHIVDDIREASHPEYKQYSIIMLIALIMATIYAFIKTWGNYEPFGYYGINIMNGEVYRYITYMFCHASIRHLIGNMISLYIFGKVYMKAEGVLSFAVVYFVGGIGAAVLDSLYCVTTETNSLMLTVGASGAIMAIIGAIAAECFTHPDFEVKRNSILLIIAAVFVTNNIGAGINIRCHVFGFICGIILGFITRALTIYENEERIKYLEKKKSRITNIYSSYN